MRRKDNSGDSKICSRMHSHPAEAKTPSVVIVSSFLPAFIGLGIVLFTFLG